MRIRNMVPALILVMAYTAAAGSQFLARDSLTLSVGAAFNREVFDGEGFGVEAGFGSALYPLDNVSLFTGYWEIADDRFRYAGLEITEHYPHWERVIPFTGAAAGYGHTKGWTSGEESFFGRVSVGVKVPLGGAWNLSTALAGWWSYRDILPEADDRNDTMISLTTGLTFQY